MDAADETLIQVTTDAPWLPPGGRAEVVRLASPPHPMSMVRLLLRRSDEVFCVPRAGTAKLDLPTRSTDADDLDGAVAIRALAAEVSGTEAGIAFVGAVRNVVERPGSDYPWPNPLAHFGVWATPDAPIIDGTWVDLATLTERHWHPLVG